MNRSPSPSSIPTSLGNIPDIRISLQLPDVMLLRNVVDETLGPAAESVPISETVAQETGETAILTVTLVEEPAGDDVPPVLDCLDQLSGPRKAALLHYNLLVYPPRAASLGRVTTGKLVAAVGASARRSGDHWSIRSLEILCDATEEGVVIGSHQSTAHRPSIVRLRTGRLVGICSICCVGRTASNAAGG